MNDGDQRAVDALLRGGLDYVAMGRALGIPPGQAYLTATGLRPMALCPDP